MSTNIIPGPSTELAAAQDTLALIRERRDDHLNRRMEPEDESVNIQLVIAGALVSIAASLEGME